MDLDVFVIDQNDNRPIFRETRYSGEVLEGSPTGVKSFSLLLFISLSFVMQVGVGVGVVDG